MHAIRPVSVALAAITCLMALFAFTSVPTAQAKKGKIHVCVTKKGPDKGAMRWVRKKKCHRGEKAMTFNKKGTPGTPGTPGQAGPAGPAGGASQDALDELRTQIDLQASRINDLEGQLGGLTDQLTQLAAQFTALGSQVGALDGDLTDLTNDVGTLDSSLTTLDGQFSSFQTTACDQLVDLTEQSNDIGDAVDAIDLDGTIPLGLGLLNPGAPANLPAFTC